MLDATACYLLSKFTMRFEWDDEKAAANLKKHNVGFEEAKTLFDDLFSIEFFDPDHSETESRLVIVGESNLRRLLIVSYTERQDSVGIISARLATPKERRDYEYGRYE